MGFRKMRTKKKLSIVWHGMGLGKQGRKASVVCKHYRLVPFGSEQAAGRNKLYCIGAPMGSHHSAVRAMIGDCELGIKGPYFP